jgi:hypothetical protein
VDRVARWPAEERAELFLETAVRRGVVPTIIEKDFWVCWTLRRLFAHQVELPAMLFKGGTSLSKVYNAIERFSEDIDVSFHRHDLGFSGARDPHNVPSRKGRGRLLDELARTCARFIATELVPRMLADFEAILGPRGAGWRLEIDRADPQTVLFSYPSVIGSGAAPYVRRVVRVEFGARSDPWPADFADLRPYAAEEFPGAFEDGRARVTVLGAKRTFWEKATILHAEYHRTNLREDADRLSRHYYDLAMLARSPVREEALSSTALLLQVARHKELFFPAAWANYGEARPGTLRLVPHDTLARSLEADYRRMTEMFFDTPPPFAEVLATLGELEAAINAPG